MGDLDARRGEVSAQTIVDELADERPIILATEGHAMVLVRINFSRAPGSGAIHIQGGLVLDPAPGQGLRALLPSEMRPAYIAAVRPS